MSKSDRQYLVSRTSEIRFWLSKTGFDKKKMTKVFDGNPGKLELKTTSHTLKFPRLQVNLCHTYLIRWKRLIKTIFRPIWRISSIFFLQRKEGVHSSAHQRENDDTLFCFPRHQKFPPLMSTRRPLQELFGSKLWTLWRVWSYKKRWNVAKNQILYLFTFKLTLVSAFVEFLILKNPRF